MFFVLVLAVAALALALVLFLLLIVHSRICWAWPARQPQKAA